MQCLSYPLAPIKCSPNYRLQGRNFIRMATVLREEGSAAHRKGSRKQGSSSSEVNHLWLIQRHCRSCTRGQHQGLGARAASSTGPSAAPNASPRGLRGALSEHGSELHRPESLLWFFLGLSLKRRQKTPLANQPPATKGIKPSLWTTSSRRDVKTVPEMTMK